MSQQQDLELDTRLLECKKLIKRADGSYYTHLVIKKELDLPTDDPNTGGGNQGSGGGGSNDPTPDPTPDPVKDPLEENNHRGWCDLTKLTQDLKDKYLALLELKDEGAYLDLLGSSAHLSHYKQYVNSDGKVPLGHFKITDAHLLGLTQEEVMAASEDDLENYICNQTNKSNDDDDPDDPLANA